MAKSIVVEFTDEQCAAVAPVLERLTPGGATIAQVYGDGMRVTTINPEQAAAIARILGGNMTALCNSAFEAHELALADSARH